MSEEIKKPSLPYAERFKTIRSNLGLTQMDLAIILGLEQRRISKYETGDVKIPMSVLDKLFEFGVNVNWFLSGNGEVFKHFSAPTFRDLRIKKENQKVLSSLIDDMTNSFCEKLKKVGLRKTEKLVNLYADNKLLFDTFLSLIEMESKDEIMKNLNYLLTLFEMEFDETSA